MLQLSGTDQSVPASRWISPCSEDKTHGRALRTSRVQMVHVAMEQRKNTPYTLFIKNMLTMPLQRHCKLHMVIRPQSLSK